MNIPKYLSIDLTLPSGTNNECFVPKKIIHKFPGHSKGVNKLQFFQIPDIYYYLVVMMD